jgi:hypothetical protein
MVARKWIDLIIPADEPSRPSEIVEWDNLVRARTGRQAHECYPLFEGRYAERTLEFSDRSEEGFVITIFDVV